MIELIARSLFLWMPRLCVVLFLRWVIVSPFGCAFGPRLLGKMI